MNEPVVWAMMWGNGNIDFNFFWDEKKDADIFIERNNFGFYGAVVVPLYRRPSHKLTDDELFWRRMPSSIATRIRTREKYQLEKENVMTNDPLSITIPIGDSGDPEIEIISAIVFMMNRLDSSIQNEEERRVASSRIAKYVHERWGVV